MFDKYSKLEKYIKIVKNFVAGAFLSIPLILGSCDYIINPSENSDSSLKNFKKTTLGSGYEMPEGLSSYNEKELLKQTGSDNFQVFTTRPTFIPDISLDKMVFYDKPSVYKILPNLSVEKLYEFNNEDINEFLSLHFTIL